MKVVIKKSTNKDKKYMAIFTNDKGKVVKKRENWNDYMSAGSLSRYILWGETTLKKSIDEYKKKFKLL